MKRRRSESPGGGATLALPRKTKYHYYEKDKNIIASLPGFWSPSLCDNFVTLAEEHGFTSEKTKEYTQATIDIEVDKSPPLKELLLNHSFVERVAQAIVRVHGSQITAFDDVFVVKYDAKRQKELLRHYDSGDVSFILALSRKDYYKGGGTNFDVLGTELVELAQGECLVFNSGMYHAGLPISSGTRYLLVGFCFTKREALLKRGNLDLNFNAVRGGSSSFDLWHIQDFSRHDPERLTSISRKLAESGTSLWVNCLSPITEAEEKDYLQVVKFARRVFWFHASRFNFNLTESSCCEVWAQDLLDGHAPSKAEAEYIPWHYDKDEEAYKKNNHLLIHPTIATVTYLTSNYHHPTVVFGEKETLISFPRCGNHLAFAGKLLHGVPAKGVSAKKQKKRRTTLLINIWLQAPRNKVASMTHITSKKKSLKNVSLVPVKEAIVELPTVEEKVPPETVLAQVENTVFAEASESGYMMVK